MNKNTSVFIEGDRIILRPLAISDVNGNYQKWLNDPVVTQYNSHGRFPIHEEELRKYVLGVANTKTSIVLAVIDKISLEHVGNISIQNISWVDRSGEIAFLLGEYQYSGKGYMYEAGVLLIRHAFFVLNLHRIYCGTSSENIAMQKLATKLGMQKEGERRDALYKEGGYKNIIEFGILKTDEIL